MDLAQFTNFEKLVDALLSTQNEIRRDAEAIFNQQKQNPDSLITLLMLGASKSTEFKIRQMCVVLLRKNLTKSSDSIWAKLTPQTQELVKNQLLNSLQNEQDKKIRSKFADAVSELGAMLLEDGKWPELLGTLFELAKSQNEFLRESGLSIFSQLAVYVLDNLKPILPQIKQILTISIQDSSMKVRVAAINSITSLVEGLTTKEANFFQDLIPAMLEVLRIAISNNQFEEEAESILESFVNLADSAASFLRPHIQILFQAMLSIIQSELDESLRHLAVEFLVSFSEQKPAIVRKIPNFSQTFIQILFTMLADLSENTNWNDGEEADNEDSNVQLAEECLDRFAIAIGGKTLTLPLFGLIQNLLNSNDWKQRHAAVMAIAISAEGCRKSLSEHLSSVINDMLAPKFADPHPRVRWAVCNAAGQLATDFGNLIQDKFHREILSGLVSLMDDTQNPRVQSHAAAAILNFCDDCDPRILTPYLDGLLSKLILLIQINNKLIQECAISAVAAIADCIDDEFTRYYDTFMPILKLFLQNATSIEYRAARGKAIECVGIVALAVGKNKFIPDAKFVVELLITQLTNLGEDDPQRSYITQTLVRLCKCLGSDFHPYLSYVMPPLLVAAQIQPNIHVTDADGPQPEEKEGWDYLTIGEKIIGIKTSTIEDKLNACSLIFSYAQELEHDFFPFVQQTAQIVVPLIKFYYDDDIRSTCACTLPFLIRATRKHCKKNNAPFQLVKELWFNIFPQLCEAMKSEPEPNVLGALADSMAECIAEVKQDPLTAEQMNQLFEIVNELIKDFFERRQQNEENKDPEADEEDNIAANEEEEAHNSIIEGIGEIFGQLFKVYKSTFLQPFQNFLPIINKLINEKKYTVDRHVSLCIIDDAIENTANPVLIDMFFKYLLEYSQDTDPKVRQASVFGIGAAAQYCQQKFISLIPESLNALSKVIFAQDAKEEENIFATENAIAAVGKIIFYQWDTTKNLQPGSLLSTWLGCLPVTEDLVESKITYDIFCNLLNNNETNQYLFGPSAQNFTKIFSIFKEIIDTDLIDKPITQKVRVILEKMFSICNDSNVANEVKQLITLCDKVINSPDQ
eukprot:TRINITY_DN1224_c0_g2_i1.p1 TRINITY_DN1224_c0_g2~~TRINITY_DN1224_c0_g2_i1.p1  ORF type:complete len:1087 (-),score=588.52 TRINITY_DN1224_c0_g2_i1:206-3466(-)